MRVQPVALFAREVEWGEAVHVPTDRREPPAVARTELHIGRDDNVAAKRIANEFADNNGNIVYSNNAGQKKYGGDFSTLSEAVMKAAEQYTFSEEGMRASNKASQPPTSTPDTTGQTTSGSGTQSSAPGKTVNINLGGRTSRVNVASDADANALVGVLRQLESAGGTAS